MMQRRTQRFDDKFKELNLPKNTTFLWTFIRQPKSQYISAFFHFQVGRKHQKPNLLNFKKYMKKKCSTKIPPQVNYIGHKQSLTLEDIKDENSKRKTVQDIINEYNFMGVVERLDESLVAL